MALAVDIKDGHGLSNEMRHQFQPRKTKVRKAILAVNIIAKELYARYITNKMDFIGVF